MAFRQLRGKQNGDNQLHENAANTPLSCVLVKYLQEAEEELSRRDFGGSVAGLTLAHCLNRCHIDYVVLERNSEIAPQVGASIGFLPTGARILDQLGIFDYIRDKTTPLHNAYYWTNTGRPICFDDNMKGTAERHGYPIAFLDRQLFLQIMYDHLEEQQNRIHLSAKVVKIEHLATKAVVHCADGSVFEGDLVVGADGVRSIVRQEMWNYMDTLGLRKEAAQERAAMTAEYSCLFGISELPPGLVTGDCHRTFADDYSALTAVGMEGRAFWFLFAKLDQKYSGTHVPRFSQQDLEKHAARFRDMAIAANVPFSALYDRVLSTSYVCLEEAFYKHWYAGRLACVGDSIHKMTPNAGQGGNCALESAASLANCLKEMLDGDEAAGSTSASSLDDHLRRWQQARQTRAKKITEISNTVTRLEAGASFKDRILSRTLLPYINGYLLKGVAKLYATGEVIDFLPLPEKASSCTMPYTRNPEDDTGSLIGRVLACAPLLACYAYANISLDTLLAGFFPYIGSLLQSGSWISSTGEALSLTEPIYNIPLLDKIFGVLVACFLPSISGSDVLSHAQMLSFMADLCPIYGIWLLESGRQAHSWAEIAFPTAMGAAFQFKGIGKIAPIYYMIEHLRTPLSKLLNRRHEVRSDMLGSFLPTMLTAYYLPTLGNFLPREIRNRQYFNAIWQLFPLTVPLLQAPFRLLDNVASEPAEELSKEQGDKQVKRRSKKTLRYIRAIYLSFAVISGLSFAYARRTLPAGSSMASVIVPGLWDYTLPVGSFTDGITRFLKYDETLAMASGFIWLGLKYQELERHGYPMPWWKVIVGMAATTAAFGPGAAMSLGWGLREEILARIAE
ncbi:FAD-dependent oxidoreductase [Aspergillus homomorphus CBS 101889]|uniref:Monooxygenase n=1 Tax=Aspergillus homomorphus (strain CBS 101889) TaxID=1450537 RepID=A0A395I2S6_ASPHC|nr:monooxygenase [Aspergillus homomorphus CBS 101889]RAL14482.1 monooxygenase [Aspergillus homomorphus CBS 101889]